MPVPSDSLALLPSMPVAAGVAQRDAALVGAHVVAEDDGVARVVERDAVAIRVARDVVEDLVAVRTRSPRCRRRRPRWIVFFSTRLLLDRMPTVPSRVMSRRTPPPFSLMVLLEDDVAGRALEQRRRRRSSRGCRCFSIRLSCERSIQIALVAVGAEEVVEDEVVPRVVGQPDADVVGVDRVVADGVAADARLEGGRRVLRGRQVQDRVGLGQVAQPDAGLLVDLQRHVLDDVAGGADVQRDAVVELADLAVADGDVVVAVVADAGADALAVDGVAVEVDRDVVGADDEAVPEAVGRGRS